MTKEKPETTKPLNATDPADVRDEAKHLYGSVVPAGRPSFSEPESTNMLGS